MEGNFLTLDCTISFLHTTPDKVCSNNCHSYNDHVCYTLEDSCFHFLKTAVSDKICVKTRVLHLSSDLRVTN